MSEYGPVASDQPPPDRSVRYAMVLVTVNPDGTVKGTALETSTGFRKFDDEALHDARNNVYQPKMVGCRAVEGTYRFLDVFIIIPPP